MKNTALLIIDMINDFQFSHGPILAQKCEIITKPILQLKKTMKSFGCPSFILMTIINFGDLILTN